MRISLFFVSLFLLFCLQSSSIASLGDIASPPTDAPAALSVSIAVPEDQGQRTILFKAANPYFDVVIHNDSSKPQKLWDENCSAGYGNVTLEVTEIDGKSLPEPLIVRRSVGVWRSNRIHTVVLQPGESAVREIHMDKGVKRPAFPLNFLTPPSFNYEDFPYTFAQATSSASIQYRRLRMRAVFESGPWGPFAKPGDVWTGRIVSVERDYNVHETFYQ